ncbi:hypothetical protein GCM10012284_20690 [Mangrovihabitans endophyticus]|uniref:histidine kinase n=1 Tax=Mangrovihabitans endophyticus TaxID=1751298 RepID=A0A8J3BWW5_9ACTN|nr:hypothetical protein GCM10012284_20690 [Mangrovihabitans endophyticus]
MTGGLNALTIWGGWNGGHRGLDLAVGLLSWVLAPLLVWRPAVGALVVAPLAALSPVGSPAATAGTLQVARRCRFSLAAAVAAVGFAAHVAQGAWRPNGGISLGWWLLLIALAHGALLGWGAWAQARAALIRSLRDRARRAEAEQGRRVAEARIAERHRIAREMHDVLAHRLSLLATFAGAMEYRPDSSPERLAGAAGVVRAGVHQALDELREVVTLLRDDDPRTADGETSDVRADYRPQPALTDIPRLIGESRETGTPVQLRDEVDDPSTAPTVTARTAYRIVQEGLTNARKHACGQPVVVTLRGRPGARLVVEIRNPLGTEPVVTPGAGVGLIGLTERVHLAGGQLDHRADDGEFRVHAWIPWPA